MGLLALGTPLDWPEAKKFANHVRRWGIEQLLVTWNKGKKRSKDALLWGDEMEYLVVKYKDDDSNVVLSLRQAEILAILSQLERPESGGSKVSAQQNPCGGSPLDQPIFHPEFGRFMIESTPGKPWGIGFKDLLQVETSMKLRRKIAKEHMCQEEFPITMTTFPRLGCPGKFTSPYFPPSGERLRSQFVPDEIANPHIRFPTLAANIRSRRGRKVQVNVPVFRDTNTRWPWRDQTVNFDLHNWPEDDDVRNGASSENFIHMDAMAFGMGSCCLQITLQAKDVTEARHLYDQLIPLGPILLALTAATPIYKGFLADTDVRWNQISASVDDRTLEELGESPLGDAGYRIPKSRYASNSTYISEDPRLRQEYLDPDLVFNKDIREQLMEAGMDSLLATHFAHLFIRDPIVIFSESLTELDLSKTDHFDNLQSTNWQHVRFKPPPADSDIGWRVEFRPMEVQLTDFENAALSVFIILVTRAILSFDLNFYIPIRKVDDNMQTAHKRNAVLEDKFYFRRNPLPSQKVDQALSQPLEEEYGLMSIETIINGSKDDSESGFPGLIPLVESYLDSMNVNVETRHQLNKYLDLVRKRADGRLWTTAKWIREFVHTHEDYKCDSEVSEKTNHDLIKAVLDFEDEELKRHVKNVDRLLP